jgi:hypothetical protein
MAICTHPNGKRIDLVCVGADQSVWHSFAPDGDFTKPNLFREGLGGKVLSVSASWHDNNQFVIVAQGTDNQFYQKSWNGVAWSPSGRGWALIPNLKAWSGP